MTTEVVVSCAEGRERTELVVRALAATRILIHMMGVNFVRSGAHEA